MDHASELELQRRALAILDAALDLPSSARTAYVDDACAHDGRLRDLVQGLLTNDRDPANGSAILDRDAGALLGALVRSEGLEDGNSALIDQRIGAWRIRSVIGRGGMGVVYHATRADGVFEQDAALKLIRFGLDTPATRERFRRERQILAQLRHSGIAVVLDGGMSACGAPYYVMELVNGQPMTDWCDARRLGLRRRVELFCQAVDAISHAHGQRVVHRDLKPSNLMVTDEGRVKLLDFGIAEWLDGTTAHAQSPQSLPSELMTPQFAAPEQIEGREITAASDIYQLGLLLYQLLSGALPYKLTAADVPTASMRERLAAMRPLEHAGGLASPESAGRRGHDPQSLGQALSGDLDAIVAACLVHQPERRYASAAALSDDLRRWLSGGAVSVRGATLWYRAGKLVSRHRVGVAMLFALTVAMLVGTASTLWQARQAANEARRAHREAVTAEAATVFLERLFSSAMPLGGNDSGTTARELLERGAQRARIVFRNDPELRFRLLSTIGQNYATMGEDSTAVELFREALAVESAEIGPVARGMSAYQLATSSFLLGRFDEALIAQALDWIDHDRTPQAQALRSNLLRLRGDIQIVTARYHQGMRSHEDARLLAERIAASDPLPLLDVLVRQAYVQWKVLNLPGRAEATFRRSEAVAARVDAREADLRRRFRIEFLIETGELALAGHLIDGALAFRSSVYGERSMGVVQPLIHRGLLKLELGQHSGAERDFLEALRIAATFDQSISNQAVAAQVGLSRAQCANGRYQLCLDGAIRARLAVVAIMGERGFAVPAMDALIAEAEEGLGRHFEAAEFARRAIAMLTSVHRPAGYPRQTLGIALYRSGKVDEGVATLRTAREELIRSRGALHAMTLATGVHLGRALLAQGRLGAARTTLLAAARQLRAAPRHARRQSLSEAYLALADVEERAGNAMMASEYARKAARVGE